MRYSINQAAEILGVSQSTIRRYEKAGLVQVRRDENGKYRYYSISDIAKLSIYLGVRQEKFIATQVNVDILLDHDRLKYARMRLEEIDKEIQRLTAIRVCYEQQVKLNELMESLRTIPDSGCIVTCESWIGTSFDSMETMFHAPFFQKLRNDDISMNYYRLFNLYTLGEDVASSTYRQAYCAPLQLQPELQENMYENKVFIPSQKCIVALSKGSSIIDDEDAQSVQENIRKVQEQTYQLTKQFGIGKQNNVFTMTVNLLNEEPIALLFIPFDTVLT